ncbi:MAG: hypothetical protein WD768_21375 [Phycisphaeraceae bacterium]
MLAMRVILSLTTLCLGWLLFHLHRAAQTGTTCYSIRVPLGMLVCGQIALILVQRWAIALFLWPLFVLAGAIAFRSRILRVEGVLRIASFLRSQEFRVDEVREFGVTLSNIDGPSSHLHVELPGKHKIELSQYSLPDEWAKWIRDVSPELGDAVEEARRTDASGVRFQIVLLFALALFSFLIDFEVISFDGADSGE